MIEVEGLTKRYGKTLAVDNISFHIRKGEVVGLLGPNGAGKTTTVRILATLLKATAGRATVATSHECRKPSLSGLRWGVHRPARAGCSTV